MKVIAEIFRAIIILALVAVIAVGGCLTAIFFVSQNEPDEIFILDYALVYRKDESDSKLDVWLLKKENAGGLMNSDGFVYYEDTSGYKAAYKNSDSFGARYYDSESYERIMIDESKIVGKIVALW